MGRARLSGSTNHRLEFSKFFDPRRLTQLVEPRIFITDEQTRATKYRRFLRI